MRYRSGSNELSASEAALIELERSYFWKNRDVAVIVGGESTSASFSNLTIDATGSRKSDGGGGIGLAAIDSSRLGVNLGLIEGSRQFGLVGTSTASIQLVNTAILGVRAPFRRETDNCTEGGHGVVSFGTAAISVERSRIQDIRHCGLLVDRGGSIQVSGSTVARSRIALCDDDAGEGRLTVDPDVVLKDNDSELTTTTFYP